MVCPNILPSVEAEYTCQHFMYRILNIYFYLIHIPKIPGGILKVIYVPTTRDVNSWHIII
jgi:hypothetical protein